MTTTPAFDRLWFAIRIVLGLIFFWAFIDKVFGLGYATPVGHGWLTGVSPTLGYLGHATHGPFASIFHSIAGNMVIDWLFMLGLLSVGLSMLTGKFLQLGGWAGVAMMVLIYVSALPPTTNPVLDEHVVYGLIFAAIAVQAGAKSQSAKK